MAAPYKWKPYYFKKDKYPDGRNKILIGWYEKGTSRKRTFTLPKPEELLEILKERFNRSKKRGEFYSKIKELQNHELSVPQVHDYDLIKFDEEEQ